MEVRSAETARRHEAQEQSWKDQEMELGAWLQHEEEERREAERKAKEALEEGGGEGSKTGEAAEL